MNTDPFASPKAGVDPRYGQQIGAMADFFDRYLKADDKPGLSSVRYEVLNGGGWRTSPSWPPPGVAARRFYAAGRGRARRCARPAERRRRLSGRLHRRQRPAQPAPVAGGPLEDRLPGPRRRRPQAARLHQHAARRGSGGRRRPGSRSHRCEHRRRRHGDRLPGRRAALRPRHLPDRGRPAPRRPQARRRASRRRSAAQLPQAATRPDDARQGASRSGSRSRRSRRCCAKASGCASRSCRPTPAPQPPPARLPRAGTRAG